MGRSIVRIQAWQENFLFSKPFKPALGAHPVSYLVGTGVVSPGGIKLPECEVDHSRSSGAEVKNE
jgi:hypothetical protein